MDNAKNVQFIKEYKLEATSELVKMLNALKTRSPHQKEYVRIAYVGDKPEQSVWI